MMSNILSGCTEDSCCCHLRELALWLKYHRATKGPTVASIRAGAGVFSRGFHLQAREDSPSNSTSWYARYHLRYLTTTFCLITCNVQNENSMLCKD